MEGESLTLKTLEGKFKKLQKLSGNNTLVTANMTALYPSISHEDGLETLRKRLVVSEDFQLVNDFALNSLKVRNSTVIIKLVETLQNTGELKCISLDVMRKSFYIDLTVNKDLSQSFSLQT